jgi:hypothetical protein
LKDGEVLKEWGKDLVAEISEHGFEGL